MTAMREAVVLPGLFLSTIGLAGLRLGERGLFAGPSLVSLVSATLLMAVTIQSGVVDPSRLLSERRSGLANANGAMVLVTAFLASAQLLSMLTPTSGVPAALVGIMVFAMLVQALAASLDRVRALRAMAVLLGLAFLLKFVVLAQLSAPADSRVARALQVLFDQVTLGAIVQAPIAAAEGYLAFAATVLHLTGLWALPPAAWHTVRVDVPLLPSSSTTLPMTQHRR